MRDGFIHLSSASQVGETARKYFSGQLGLVIVAFESVALGPSLRWETSRGGELFPHLYAELPASVAVAVAPLPLDEHGVPVLPTPLPSC